MCFSCTSTGSVCCAASNLNSTLTMSTLRRDLVCGLYHFCYNFRQKKKKTVFCYILVKRGQCYTQMMLLKPIQFSGVISVCSRNSVKAWENVEGQETVTAALPTFSSTPKVGRTFITVRNVRCKDLNLWAFRGSPSSLLWMMKEQTAAQTKIGQIQGGEMLYLKVWR